MTGKRIGYVRVSTADQNPDRQLTEITLDKKFIEYASGKNVKRPQLEAMLSYVREDDAVYIDSMDRLARNSKDLHNLVDHFIANNIEVHFLKENISFKGGDSPISKLLLSVMGAIAEFEHAIIRERMLEGIAIAKKKGKYKGRKSCMNSEKMEKLKSMNFERKTKMEIARELGISRFSLYKYLKQIQNEKK